MKKIFTFVITLFLGAGLTLAQTGGDKSSLNPQPLPPGKKATAQSTTPPAKSTAKKGHKGGKKSKKNSGGSTTPPPK